MNSSKFQVQWEDDEAITPDEIAPHQELSFEDLLAQEEDQSEEIDLSPGSKVSGVISFLSPDSNDVMVDLGGKNSAIISKRELVDEDEKLLFKEGDTVEAFILSANDGEITLGRSMDHRAARIHAIDDAFRNRIPVKGKVKRTIKGGVEVHIMGRNAFCPISQLDIQYIPDASPHVDKDYEFMIYKWSGLSR